MIRRKKSILAGLVAAVMALSSSVTTAALPGEAGQENAGQANDAVIEGRESSADEEKNVDAQITDASSADEMKEAVRAELLSQELPRRMSGAVSVISATEEKTASVSTQQTAVTGEAGGSADVPEKAEETEDTGTPALTHPIGESCNELYSGYATGRLPSDKDDDSIPVIRTQSDYYAAAFGESSRNKPRAVVLPERVDNSQSPYFPAIGDQGSLGSCAVFASVYYQFTYMYNKAHGIVTTPENTFSAKFTYNHVNHADKDAGSTFIANYRELTEFGAATLSEVPYDNDVKSWCPEESIYRNAAGRRLESFEEFELIGKEDSFITSTDDEDLLPIKTALANGEVLTCGTFISSWRKVNLKSCDSDPSVNKDYVGKESVISCDGIEGGHGMTIVGYDDTIWTDINGNNVPDAGEFGALRIANSWDPTYSDKGFIWVSYDALNKTSQVQGAYNAEKRECIFDEIYRISVRKNYEPRYFIRYTANTNDRYNFCLKVNGEWANTSVSKSVLPQDINTFCDKLSFDGTHDAKDATLVYDLDNVLKELHADSIEEISLSVTLEGVSYNDTFYKVKDVEIYDEKNPSVKYKADSGIPFELSSGENTVLIRKTDPDIAVIYYYGYESPLISYKLAGSSSSEDNQPMYTSIEAEGYDSKYVIRLDGKEYADVSFGDASGHKDDNNGSFYRAVRGTNKFYTPGAGAPLTSTFQFRYTGEADRNVYQYVQGFPSGGCIPYKVKLQVFDLATNTMIDDGEYCIPFYGQEFLDSGTVYYHFTEEGKFRVKAIVTDARGQSFSESQDITIKDKYFIYSRFEITNTEETLQPGVEINFLAETEYDDQVPGYYYHDLVILRDGIEVYRKEGIEPAESDIENKHGKVITSFTPELGGKYTAIISRITLENEYNFAKLDFEVSDPELTITRFSVSPESDLHVGEVLKTSVVVDGASRSRTTTLTMYKNGAPVTVPADINSTIRMPYVTGPCTIVADVYDNIYKTHARAEKKVWINPVRITDITADSNPIYTDIPVQIGAELNCSDDTASFYDFYYEIYDPEGRAIIASTNTHSGISFVPKQAGDYKVVLNLSGDDKVIAKKTKTITVEENPTPPPGGILITVAVISYIENEGNQPDYRLHYWNGSSSGDAELTATGETIKASVGSSYWSGAEKTFTVYKAIIPEDSTGFKFHIGDRWFGSDGNVSTSNGVYIFNYSGDKAKYDNF